MTKEKLVQGGMLVGFVLAVALGAPSYLFAQKPPQFHIESKEEPDIVRRAPLIYRGNTTAPLQSSAAPSAAAVQTSLGPNLIPNNSLESGISGLPTNWAKGGYGTNTRILSYPSSPAQDGSRAAAVSITFYTSGDAKWYFNYVPVGAGKTYQFSDWSQGNVPSEVDVQIKMSDGTFKYIVLAHPPASSSYQNTTGQFSVPAGAESLTVFHLIKQVGTLTVDNYSLNEVSDSPPPPPPPGNNLIPNGDFETSSANGLPQGWVKGGWGSNTRTFAYPASGVGGSKAAQVSISSYTSGDAKWAFTPIQLPSGIYSYSDSYKSDAPTVVLIQFHNSDGSFRYQDLAYDSPQSTFVTQKLGFIVPSGVQDITIFHVLKSVGTLTIDNAMIEANTNTQGVFKNGGVTLTFDDGLLSQYQNAIPKLTQYGFKGTFYIITHQLSDYGYPGFVSKAQIQDMYAKGMEIGAHTQTHRALSQLPSAEQQQEISGSRQELKALNVGPINSFAYPFGDYNAATIELVKSAGYTNARSTINGYTTPNSDHYQLPRFGVLNTTTASQIKGWIDEAIAQKSWLILVFHPIDNSGTQYGTTPAIFGEVVDYLKTKNVSVVTVAEGVAALEP